MDEGELPDNERLSRLWNEGRRQAVLDFLRRALTHDCTLADVFDALSFPEVQEHLHAIRLDAVLSFEPAPVSDASSKHISERTERLREKLLSFLSQQAEGATITQLTGMLRDEGANTPSVVIAQLLKRLAETGEVQDCGGHPIVWRARVET